jgi:hypothetical protein
MTGFMPPVRKMQVQSGEPNNLRVGFGGNAAGNSGRRRVAAAPGTPRPHETRKFAHLRPAFPSRSSSEVQEAPVASSKQALNERGVSRRAAGTVGCCSQATRLAGVQVFHSPTESFESSFIAKSRAPVRIATARRCSSDQ